jgi:hypothetical protein
MKAIHSKSLVGLIIVVLIVGTIGYQMLRLDAMFQPHTYNWGTGMPFLCDQAGTFRQVNQRWPTNYNELATFMKQSTNYAPFDRIDFITKSDRDLEIDAYVFNSRITRAPDASIDPEVNWLE